MNNYLKIPTPRFEMTEKSVMHYNETHKVHKVIANKKKGNQELKTGI